MPLVRGLISKSETEMAGFEPASLNKRYTQIQYPTVRPHPLEPLLRALHASYRRSVEPEGPRS